MYLYIHTKLASQLKEENSNHANIKYGICKSEHSSSIDSVRSDLINAIFSAYLYFPAIFPTYLTSSSFLEVGGDSLRV